MINGLRYYDMSKIAEGAGNLGGVVAFYTRDREQHECIDMMSSLSKTDFPEFKKMFFDNGYKANEGMRYHQP